MRIVWDGDGGTWLRSPFDYSVSRSSPASGSSGGQLHRHNEGSLHHQASPSEPQRNRSSHPAITGNSAPLHMEQYEYSLPSLGQATHIPGPLMLSPDHRFQRTFMQNASPGSMPLQHVMRPQELVTNVPFGGGASPELVAEMAAKIEYLSATVATLHGENMSLKASLNGSEQDASSQSSVGRQDLKGPMQFSPLLPYVANGISMLESRNAFR